MNAVAKRDEVHLVTPASLEEVFVSSEGSVEGVAIRHGDQGVETVRTGRVVLASGGYAGKPELVARYAPSIAGALYFGSQWNTGDALGIVQRMGGDVGYLDAYQGYGAISTRLGIMVNWPLAMHGGVIVNQAGSRFGDETSGYSEFAELVEAQPGRTAWMLFDREVARRCQRFPDFRELERTLDLNWSADASELAEHMRVDAEALAATLEQAGLAAAGTEADRFGRRNWERMLSFPLAAVGIRRALFHSQGRALVDGQARLLRDGTPVPGLYAAGGAAAGISGAGPSGYMAGNGLLARWGWLAGRAPRQWPAGGPWMTGPHCGVRPEHDGRRPRGGMTTMRAWRVHGAGEPRDVLQLDTLPAQVPGRTEVVVSVEGAALGFPDVMRAKARTTTSRPGRSHSGARPSVR